MYDHCEDYSVVKMCEVLEVSKSGYYKWLCRREADLTERERYREEIKQKISQSFHESFGTYGSPRVHADLIDWGYTVCQKTVARMMKEMGLRATLTEKIIITTDSNHDLPIYPNLLNQNFTVDAPNKAWVTDITYIWTIEGWLYLASVIDLFSRKMVGWSMAPNMKKELPLAALKMAIATRQPGEGLIHHSDRGSQYCSHGYMEVLKERKMEVSMSRIGNPYDNACIESFHATLKKELVYRVRFEKRAEAIKAINYYISNRYNEKRRHSTLGYYSPNNFERHYQNSILKKTS
ncbi:IS3 family transposase [Oceanobacillus kapialis]